MNVLIQNQLKSRILSEIIDIAPVTDSWQQSDVFINLGLEWQSPVSTHKNGWLPIKKFHGTATLALIDDSSKQFELMELISVFSKPVKIQLDETVLTGELGVTMSWYLKRQKQAFSQQIEYTYLEGDLQGNLFRKQ